MTPYFSTLAELPIDLGQGEREAIALAIDSGADLVILDDQQGRLVSRDKGLSVTGTVGVLIEAKERGFIPSLRPEMDRLIEAGGCGLVKFFTTGF